MRREILRSPKSPKTSLAAQAVLRQVENERDNASADLQRIMTERDSLQERLRVISYLNSFAFKPAVSGLNVLSVL